jgi:hypothetical protein
MKKGIAAILLLLYTAFSSGVVVSLHYCMDRLDSFGIGATKTDMCSKCGMPVTEGKSCCTEVVKIFKIQDDQLASAAFKLNAPDAQPGEPPATMVYFPAQTGYRLIPNNHSPPLSGQYTYLYNCVFRI